MIILTCLTSTVEGSFVVTIETSTCLELSFNDPLMIRQSCSPSLCWTLLNQIE